ncbi:MAG: TonB-dependent receptor plug domain-containing protein [Desulfuromonadaceae bacterium]|nr:TonB-dependent receptor plug domain-containing protein [Desulfuromonadaceae bacterium]
MTGYSAPSFAVDELLDAFGLVSDETLTVSSHFPRPASKIAENVTIISADDIARINAHTLRDVLQTVSGIQLDYVRTPGTFSLFNVQGALNSTVLVLIDGVRQNDLTQNMAWPGLIPVQQIERIEIIRGAASTAWGSALGGVINISTKVPEPDRKTSGMASASTGKRHTSDSRAELSGTVDRFGYYLSGGNLHSDGLLPNNGINQNNLYGKLSYLLPTKGTLTIGYSYLESHSGMDEEYLASWDIITHDNYKNHQSYGFINLDQPLGERLKLELLSSLTKQDNHGILGHLDSGVAVADLDTESKEYTRNFNGRLFWGDNLNNLATGFEYTHANGRSKDLLSSDPPLYDRTWNRWAAYSNAAFTLGRLTVLPGLRLDHTGVSSENFSYNYTLGATFKLAENTLLRAYGAKGYGLPIPFTSHGLMKISTVQGGIESSDVPYLWLKGTCFMNWLKDMESFGDSVLQNQTRQGVELEARTIPLYGLSLSSGYTFTSVRNEDTGATVQTNSQWSVPPQLLKLALNYDNKDVGLRGALTGNYLKWNKSSDSMAANGAMICDLFLSLKLRPNSELSPELFFSARNLFNGVQTTDTELYTNAPRWIEGGVRFKF